MQQSGQKPHPTDADLQRSNVQKLIGSRHFTVADLKAKSPVPIADDPGQQFRLALSSLYLPDECIELIAAVRVGTETKSAPLGNKLRHTVTEWIELSQARHDEAQLGSRCGTFMRINPVEGSRAGGGANGSTTDADVAAHRYCLVEHDNIPKDMQASLLAVLPLPIAAIVDSGGQSLHAWVKVGAAWGGPYAEEVKALYGFLNLLGFDAANKNPSRLTRAPGFARSDDPADPQQQALLYLNPDPANAPIFNFPENI